MSGLSCKPLLTSWNPLTQLIRCRTRTPDIRRPIPPHRLRAVALKLTKPVYDESIIPTPPIKPLKFEVKTKQVNPFERILANEFYQILESSKVVAIFHKNPMDEKEINNMKLLLHKNKMKYLWYSNTVAQLAMEGTYFEPLLQLYKSHTATVVSEENTVAKLLKLEKKMPGVVLMGALVEGRLMSIADLKRYATLPSLEVLQGQLVGILGAPAQRLSYNLTHHQIELSSALSRFISDQTKPPQEEEEKE